jgi:sirohydrochlorin cobaltochelatase
MIEHKKALVLIAHGSRLKETSIELQKLVSNLEKLVPDFYSVSVAYLEISTPSLEEEFNYQLSKGITEFVFLPYLLAQGRHLNTDIPNTIGKLSKEHPTVKINLIPHIGVAEAMSHFIADHIQRSKK